MRYELCSQLASSAMHALRMLQEVIDDQDVQKLQQNHAALHTSPNLMGCVDSPEASTILLMVIGVAGIYFGSSLFARLKRNAAANV